MPVVVVLDALDECGDLSARWLLLVVLVRENALATVLRFIITSRAEYDIRTEFENRAHIILCELDTISDANTTNILSYSRHHAKNTRDTNQHLRLTVDW